MMLSLLLMNFIFLTMEPSKFNISPSKTEVKVKFDDDICLCKQTIKECLGIKKISNCFLKQVNVKTLSSREITNFNNEYKKLINKVKVKKSK